MKEKDIPLNIKPSNNKVLTHNMQAIAERFICQFITACINTDQRPLYTFKYLHRKPVHFQDFISIQVDY